MYASFSDFLEEMGHHKRLIETLEFILTAENITGFDVNIIRWKDDWTIDIESCKSKIFIPSLCSEFHPPYIVLEEKDLISSVESVTNFIEEIKSHKIIIEHIKQKSMGYIELGGTSYSTNSSIYQFLFVDHKKIIDFYQVFKKYSN